jgi:glycine C-acetyltransferase
VIVAGDAALAAIFADAMASSRCLCDRLQLPRRAQCLARIRAQISAADSQADLETAINAFVQTRRQLGL